MLLCFSAFIYVAPGYIDCRTATPLRVAVLIVKMLFCKPYYTKGANIPDIMSRNVAIGNMESNLSIIPP